MRRFKAPLIVLVVALVSFGIAAGVFTAINHHNDMATTGPANHGFFMAPGQNRGGENNLPGQPGKGNKGGSAALPGHMNSGPVGHGIGGPGDERTGLELILRFAGFLLFLAAVLWVIKAVLAHLASTRGRAPASAIAELDLKYARGEVKREEYLERRSDLLQAGQ